MGNLDHVLCYPHAGRHFRGFCKQNIIISRIYKEVTVIIFNSLKGALQLSLGPRLPIRLFFFLDFKDFRWIEFCCASPCCKSISNDFQLALSLQLRWI